MTSSNSILRSTALLAIGGVLGAGLTLYLGKMNARRNFAGRTSLQSISLMHQIDLIDQKNYSELRDDLESHLDSDTCILGLFASKSGEAGSLAKSQLTKINNHRKQHPYESPSPEFRRKVEAALSIAK